MTGDLLPLAVAALDHAALALIVGAAAAQLVLLSLPHMPARTVSALTPLLLGALALLACSGAGELVLRTAALADVAPGAAWPYIGQALTHSDYGMYWLLRTVAWLALVALIVPTLRRGSSAGAAPWGVAAGAGVIVFTMSATGHGGNEGGLALPNLINTAHIAATFVWGGTAAVYMAAVLPRLRHGAAPAPTVALTATRLSALSGTALALVLATGIYNTWRQLADWSDLWTTPYGTALLAKLAGVGIMMAIGAANFFFLVPAVVAWSRRTRGEGDAPVLVFLRVLRFDAAVFVFVLACAALLGTQVPPAHMTDDAVSRAAATRAADAGGG